jgi:hypothetical protein
MRISRSRTALVVMMRGRALRNAAELLFDSGI